MSARCTWLLCGALAACAPAVDPADCDRGAALELVYDADGAPAFAGQALVIRHCGAGAFCHAATATGADRFGVPAGLDYDLRPAASGPETNAGAVARLGRDQERMLEHVADVWAQVSSGRMPVRGAGGEAYEGAVGLSYDRVSPTGAFTALPSIRAPEGEAIFRNWLACGAPVVERSADRLDGADNEVGFTAPACARRCVRPTWESIYRDIVAAPEESAGSWTGGRCAGSRCHSAEARAGELVLDGGPERGWAALVDVEARGSECVGASEPLVRPGEPDASLLWRKVGRPTVCGRPMPSSGSRLGVQALCAIREWIGCGACASADDPACASCLAAAEERCGYDAEKSGGCVEPAPCNPSLPTE